MYASQRLEGRGRGSKTRQLGEVGMRRGRAGAGSQAVCGAWSRWERAERYGIRQVAWVVLRQMGHATWGKLGWGWVRWAGSARRGREVGNGGEQAKPL